MARGGRFRGVRVGGMGVYDSGGDGVMCDVFRWMINI